MLLPEAPGRIREDFGAKATVRQTRYEARSGRSARRGGRRGTAARPAAFGAGGFLFGRRIKGMVKNFPRSWSQAPHTQEGKALRKSHRLGLPVQKGARRHWQRPKWWFFSGLEEAQPKSQNHNIWWGQFILVLCAFLQNDLPLFPQQKGNGSNYPVSTEL